MGLRSKFLIIFLLTLPLFFLVFAYSVICDDFESREKALYANAELLTELVERQLIPLIQMEDKEKIVGVLSLLKNDPTFVKISLFNPDNQFIAEYSDYAVDKLNKIQKRGETFAIDHSLFSNTVLKKGALGQVKVMFTKGPLQETYRNNWIWALFMLGLMVCSIIFFTFLMIRVHVLEPFKKLRQAIIVAIEGNLNEPILEPSKAEVGLLTRDVEKLRLSLKGVIDQLAEAAKQTTSAYTEIQVASKQQEAAVLEQEAAAKQIAVTIKEISSTTRDLAYTMQDVNVTAEEASSLAVAGNEGLNRMLTIMQKMVESSNHTANNLAILNDKANNIKSVIVTMTKVADQTNLLSLNSAIEAEIAGEHGRKFAVIAREIRRLADQTAYASLDINNIVNEMTSAVSSNVRIIDQFSKEIRASANQLTQIISDQLAKIIDKVQQQKISIENVTEGMQSQLQAAEQITDAVLEWSESTKETRNSMGKFKKTIDLLWSYTQKLQSFMGKYKRP